MAAATVAACSLQYTGCKALSGTVTVEQVRSAAAGAPG
jgi:hypothetical protein